MLIRPVEQSDAAAMLAIYVPIVRETAISFETEPPTLPEFEERVRKYSQDWAWLVAEHDRKLIGYAYGSSHRERLAYKWSTETSAYVHEDERGQGVGKKLYQALLRRLAEKGYCNAYAGIALPNVGQFPAVGRKFGKWHDVGWLHCSLRSEPPHEA
jgi:L-amino acid N-acyltransferase YncA